MTARPVVVTTGPRLLSILVVLLVATACGSGGPFGAPPSLTRPCAVIVDASGSASKFRAEDRLQNKFATFLDKQGCGTVGFVPLNSLSDHSACTQEQLNLDPPQGEPSTVRPAMRTLAVKRATALLDCARKEPNDSDVLGALRKAADIRPADSANYAVFIDSDMIQIDDRMDMLHRRIGTPQDRAKLIAEVADLTPTLSDTVLYPTDLGANIDDARLGQDVKAFWTELFATDKAGHPTLEMTYA
jgi:hypothetical protein